jgi:hypothetical protein
MFITFFNIKGIVHKEFVLEGQTVNFAYHCDILWGLLENVKTSLQTLAIKELAAASQQRSHTSFFTGEFFTLVSHPSYSPDLAPCDIQKNELRSLARFHSKWD